MFEQEKPLKDLEGGTNVSETYHHYITKNIKAMYKRKIVPAVIFLGVIIILFFASPVFSMLRPLSINSESSITESYNQNKYVKATLKNLYFTGYTKKFLDSIQGYYYYTMIDKDCVIVLLSPETCKYGESYIKDLVVDARIVKNGNSETHLFEYLAKDLNWKSDITKYISSYSINEPDANDFASFLLKHLVLIFGIADIIIIILYTIFIFVPKVSPSVLRLRSYGNPYKILEQAELEIATLPQLATEDMYITENFFIEVSKYGIAIVPIKEIIWIYKYSHLNKILWHHFSISYTLHITAKKRQYIKCPKNIKSDIDGVIEYLAEANHKILIGFNEENRLKVQEIQGDLKWFDKIMEKFHEIIKYKK